MAKKCIHCGTLNPDSANFCRKCGNKIGKDFAKPISSQNQQLLRKSVKIGDMTNPFSDKYDDSSMRRPGVHEKPKSGNRLLNWLMVISLIAVTYFLLGRYLVDGITKRNLAQSKGPSLANNTYFSIENQPNIDDVKGKPPEYRERIDIDWNVGPMLSLSWDAHDSDIPQEFVKYQKEPQPSDSLPRHINMKVILSKLPEYSNTICFPIHSSYVFRFHEIIIVSEQCMFIGNMPHMPTSARSGSPNVFTGRGRPRPEDYNVKEDTSGAIAGSAQDTERYQAAVDNWIDDCVENQVRIDRAVYAAASTLKLKAIYLFPEGSNSDIIIENLSRAFRATPLKKQYSLIIHQDQIRWDIAEWQDEYSICRYVDVTQNGRSLTHYILIASPSGLETLTNIGGLDLKSSTSREISTLLKLLDEKEWQAGYGWIRQRLGQSLDLPDAVLSIIGIPAHSDRLIYPYSVAGDLFFLAFLFDDYGMLSSIHLLPHSESNPKRIDSGLSAIEKRQLFEKCLADSKHKLPDEEIGLLQKAAELYPDDPDLRERKVPRFTKHNDLDDKEKYYVEHIVVDWQTGLEWIVASQPYYDMEGTWYKVREWVDNLRHFHGGGWKMPSLSDVKSVQARKGFPIAIYHWENGSIWSGDVLNHDLNAYHVFIGRTGIFDKVRPKGESREIDFMVACRPLNRAALYLRKKFAWYDNDPSLSIDEIYESAKRNIESPKNIPSVNDRLDKSEQILFSMQKIPSSQIIYLKMGDKNAHVEINSLTKLTREQFYRTPGDMPIVNISVLVNNVKQGTLLITAKDLDTEQSKEFRIDTTLEQSVHVRCLPIWAHNTLSKIDFLFSTVR